MSKISVIAFCFLLLCCSCNQTTGSVNNNSTADSIAVPENANTAEEDTILQEVLELQFKK